MLSSEEIREIEHELAIVPERRAACIEGLKAVQKHRGWVSDEAIADLALYLEMSVEDLDSVATFYNLIFRRPVGRHVIRLCESVSCWILGYERLLEEIRRQLGIDWGQTTADGRFTLTPIQCLGACDHAPALMIDDDLHQDLDPASLGDVLARYR